MNNLTVPDKKILSRLFMAFAITLLSACSSMTSTPGVSVDVSERWALLPISNLSETAQADAQAHSMVETQLRARGIRAVDTYAPIRQVSLRQLLDPGKELKQARNWAMQSGYRYGLSGTIHEWQYKTGADREPAVGMSLKLVDLYSGEVVWQANAARTGWGYASLPSVADGLIRDLLDQVQFTTSSL